MGVRGRLSGETQVKRGQVCEGEGARHVLYQDETGLVGLVNLDGEHRSNWEYVGQYDRLACYW